ncbi:MAG: cytochrome d ubiquinol oxidase subunit II [Desulfitobacteriaceae bacterium]
MSLPVIWFLLVGVLVIVYAILDGFDLGIGSLYYFLAKTPAEKKTLMQSIGPVWDGNEVWLLTGGGALFAAFPLVYASAFSAFYLALLLVLFALIARGISIEYAAQTTATPTLHKTLEVAFSIGSFLPALLYGVAMGNVAQGIPLDSAQNYTGTFFQLLNPYALLFGLVGLAAFLLQGATYAMLKTEGTIAQRAKTLAPKIWAGFVILYILASVYSLAATPQLFHNYQNYPLLFFIPVLSWLALLSAPVFLTKGQALPSFLASSLSLAFMILTLAVGLFPNLLPATTDPNLSLTIYNASSSPLTLKTMLIIVLIGLPFVLVYTIYAYRVFHGKVRAEHEGY